MRARVFSQPTKRKDLKIDHSAERIYAFRDDTPIVKDGCSCQEFYDTNMKIMLLNCKQKKTRHNIRSYQKQLLENQDNPDITIRIREQLQTEEANLRRIEFFEHMLDNKIDLLDKIQDYWYHKVHQKDKIYTDLMEIFQKKVLHSRTDQYPSPHYSSSSVMEKELRNHHKVSPLQRVGINRKFKSKQQKAPWLVSDIEAQKRRKSIPERPASKIIRDCHCTLLQSLIRRTSFYNTKWMWHQIALNSHQLIHKYILKYGQYNSCRNFEEQVDKLKKKIAVIRREQALIRFMVEAMGQKQILFLRSQMQVRKEKLLQRLLEDACMQYIWQLNEDLEVTKDSIVP